MWVDSKTFMELVERMTVMELRLKQAEERIKTLEKKQAFACFFISPCLLR